MDNFSIGDSVGSVGALAEAVRLLAGHVLD
jgi:hypothetical protein